MVYEIVSIDSKPGHNISLINGIRLNRVSSSGGGGEELPHKGREKDRKERERGEKRE